jgi:aminopeptidase N
MVRSTIFTVLAGLLLTVAPASAQRLPGTVTPRHYDLAFDVNLGAATFAGVETIEVELAEPSRRIVLHALEIRFSEATIAAGGVTQKASVSLDVPTQTAALVVPRELPRGPAQIRIRYSAALNKDLRGFYVSRANNRNYAVTQFESTDARRAFPGFDEPAFKATFSVTLTIDAHDTAISNGALLSDTPGPGAGRHTLKFAESPKMSSYLVAMAVGDFACLERSAEGIPIRICATPDKKELGRIALDAAAQILAFYNRYYSIKYPFGKLDAVAVPDFAAGAMENTAAIFYREVDLLADEKTASVGNVMRIWDVLAHEMAHQWFGDLVTMRWWDDLWLNEGFATWMEKQPLAAAKPEWHMDVEAALDTQAAMNLDGLASTRPIHATVETPAQIEESFDQIAYEKGGSVMRMIEGYLGTEIFRKGVNAYLEKFQYSNATSQDFWTAVAAASGQPVDRILPTFVNQPGVPLLSTSLSCTGGRSELAIDVRRFVLNPASTPTTGGSGSWQVPVCPKTPGQEARACQIVSAASSTLNVPGGCPSWAFINRNAEGYFRTAYTPELLRAIAPDIQGHLTPPERLSLAGDEWALVRAGQHTVADFLTLAAGFGQERIVGVLDKVREPLGFIRNYLTTDRTRPGVERFVQRLFEPLFAELGINGASDEKDDRRALRASVIELLGSTANDRDVAARARQLLDEVLAGRATLEPTAASAVVRVAAEHGDAALFDQLMAAAKRADSPSERYRYLFAIGEFTDPALVQRGLDYTLSPELRSQDTSLYLREFLRNPAINMRAWAFVKQHWSALAPKFSISGGDVGLVLSLQSFCDVKARDDIRAFLASHKLPAASRSIDQTLERINSCIAVKERQTPALESWLSTR